MATNYEDPLNKREKKKLPLEGQIDLSERAKVTENARTAKTLTPEVKVEKPKSRSAGVILNELFGVPTLKEIKGAAQEQKLDAELLALTPGKSTSSAGGGYSPVSPENALGSSRDVTFDLGKDQGVGERYRRPGGGTQYETPQGIMESDRVISGPKRGGFVDPRQDTKSGGDVYGGVDVSQMTPGEYRQHKVSSMERAAQSIKELRIDQAGGLTSGGTVRGSSRGVVQGTARAAREREANLSKYKSELNSVLYDIKRGKLTAAGGRNAIAGLKAYNEQLLGMSPSMEEGGKDRRTGMVADAQVTSELLRQEGGRARELINANRQSKMTPNWSMGSQIVGDAMEVPFKMEKLSGTTKYPPAVESAKQMYFQSIKQDPSMKETALAAYKLSVPAAFKEVLPEDLF